MAGGRDSRTHAFAAVAEPPRWLLTILGMAHVHPECVHAASPAASQKYTQMCSTQAQMLDKGKAGRGNLVHTKKNLLQGQ